MSAKNYGGILISVGVLLGWMTKTDGEVCGNITLKSLRASDYDHLQNCTIIEGNVGVFLGMGNFGGMNDISMDLSFPNIVEITNYLLVYKSYQLESLSHLFPNLIVIRGHELLGDQALSILDNENLRDVGLTSLTTILRGGVVIKNNLMLCYVDLIDWRRIVSQNYHNHIDVQEVFDRGICPYKCPSSCPFLPTPHGKAQFCWNLEHCQRFELDNCSPKTQTCFYDSNGLIENCASECLGGCDHDIAGPQNGGCHSCRNLRIGSLCQSSCPQRTFTLKDYRCVSNEECSAEIDTKGSGGAYKPFEGQCLSKCPENTKEEDGTCKVCTEHCQIECEGGVIFSADALAKFVGCTVIKGSLSIILKGRNIFKKLDQALSKVRVIEGGLLIYRVSLISLDVFKSLEVIEGRNLEGDYSLTLSENENLKKMFPQRTPEHRVKIYRTVDGVRYPGRVFINYNPHLCKEEVEAVLGPTLNDSQVSDKTNGDKAQCNPMHLKVNTTARLSDFGGTEIRLEFKNFQKTIFDMNQVDDLRVFKTFQVHYRKLELPTFKAQNLTKYGQRDLCLEQCSNSANRASSSSSGTNRPCDKSVWQTVEFEPIGSDTNESSLTWPNEVLRITDVEPNTYYGLFVTTLLVREYMVNQKFSGAESEIIYIKSPVYYPSKPEGLSIVNINYTTFNIMWEPPSSPNGEIDHYELLLELKSNSLVLERNDNFCDKQFQNGFIDSKTDKESNVTATNVSEDKQLPEDDIQKQLCACSSSQCQQSDNQVVQGPITEENRISKDVFQTLVINSAFPTRENFPGNDNDDESTETKAKRSIRDDADEQITTKDNLVPEVHIDSGSTSTWVQTPQREDNAYRVFYTPVPSQKTSFQATYLKHFGEYSVKLRACHAPKWVGETFVKWCSLPAFQNPLVYPKPGADDIAESSLHYRLSNGSDPTWLIWDPPKDPNGHILSYLIRYKSDANGTDVSHSCISANDFEKFGNRFPLPMKESYFVSVKAISMSAQGNWTNFIWVDQSSETRSVHWFIIAPIALMFLILAFIVSYLYFRWVQEKQRKSTFATQNPNYCPMEYIADEWEIKRASVIIGEKIGKGAFAVVHKGTYVNPKGGPTEVAIKMPHEDAEHLECMQFLQEAHLMKEIKAVHVVQLVGVVSVNLPYMVLLEYMALGDLRTYLTTHRPNSEFNLTNKPPPTFARMYQMALEIADGMAYLANQIKSVVHRDLAARNCLVSAQGIVKIADFGMARQVYDNYQKHGPGKMPVRWMSPEALRGEFSTKTDVWSYGVVLWEIVTLGDLPYPGLSHNEVMQFVDHQKVMPKPESCPEHFYSLMRRCWHRHLWQRPTFLDIAQELQPWANERFLRESYLTSQEGKSALKAQREPKRQEENVPIDPWASSTAEECIPLTQNGGSPRMHGVGKEG